MRISQSRAKDRGCRFLDSVLLICTLIFLNTACEVPNLDPPECTDSRTALREFYSFHFGNEMGFSNKGLEARKRFITGELFEIAKLSAEGTDPFTSGTDDIPRAFRVAACRSLSADRTEFDVLLFWKDEDRSEQRVILVETVNREGKWLASRIIRN